MIIWTGMGFLVAVFVFGCSFAANLITNALIGEPFYDENQWPFGVSLIIAAALCWFIGRSLANRRTRSLVDKDTGEEVIVRPNHSLFFIKMHWWGPILLVVGVTVAVIDLMK